MKRAMTAALFSFIVAAGAHRSPAEEIVGKFKTFDAEKSLVTVTVGDTDRALAVAPAAKVTAQFGKKVKKATTQDFPGGLPAVKEGASVTLAVESKDGKDLVTGVKLDELQPKLKKKNKKKNK